MQTLQVIIGLVQNFTNAEVKNVERVVFRNKSKSKLWQLFTLIYYKNVLELDELIRKIYKERSVKSVDSFRKLCDRFLDVVLEVISNQENFDQEKASYSEPYYNRKWLLKNIDLLQVLSTKKIPFDWLMKFIESLEHSAKKYEYIEELVLILKFKIGIAADNELYKKYYDATSEYYKYLRYCELNSKSEFYLVKYIVFVQHHSIDDKSRIEDMQRVLLELEEYYLETKLIFILFRKLMIELQLLHYREDFESAEQVVLKLIEITENCSPLKNFGRIAANYMNLAFTQFYLYKFYEAYDNSLKSIGKIKLPGFVRNASLDSTVFALIYLKQPSEAEEKLTEILRMELIGSTPAQFAKRNLMMAFIKYLQKDYKGAFKYLQKTKEIETDKEGWNLGIRMLNIYLTLSTDKVDLADQRISSMRKHIERTVKQRNMRKRDVVIFRVLSHLSRSGFDFADTWAERQKDFQLLKSDLPDYKWVPRSHELIIFDQWFEAKMKGVEYDPVFPSPKPKTVVEKN
jgi:hypothetical protein